LALLRFSSVTLNNLNIKNKASSVDYHRPNSNIYIELKYIQLSSDDYNTTLFGKTKVDIWNSSKKLSEACVYICFGFADDKYDFIKYNKELFGSFDTKQIDKWNATHYLVSLNQCISLDESSDDIKLLTSSC